MSLNDTDKETSKLVNELKSIDKCRKPIVKKSFLKNVSLFLSAKEKVLNNFKSKIFPIKYIDKILTPDSTPCNPLLR